LQKHISRVFRNCKNTFHGYSEIVKTISRCGIVKNISRKNTFHGFSGNETQIFGKKIVIFLNKIFNKSNQPKWGCGRRWHRCRRKARRRGANQR
jgi:hypothetical protein